MSGSSNKAHFFDVIVAIELNELIDHETLNERSVFVQALIKK